MRRLTFLLALTVVLRAPSPAPFWLGPLGFRSKRILLTTDGTENCTDMIKLLSVFCSPQSFGVPHESQSLVVEASPLQMHLSVLLPGGLTDVKAPEQSLNQPHLTDKQKLTAIPFNILYLFIPV